MGLFGNPNKGVEKTIKKLQKAGYTSTSYKSRKCCENCKYWSSIGVCNVHKRKSPPAELCNSWWGK